MLEVRHQDCMEGLRTLDADSVDALVTDPPRSGVVAGGELRNTHPTVKPLALMRWLVRLVTPLGSLVLDPFAGTGTTLVACALEGFDGVGFETEAEYVRIAEAKIKSASTGGVGGR